LQLEAIAGALELPLAALLGRAEPPRAARARGRE
jgi:hypothetical protein